MLNFTEFKMKNHYVIVTSTLVVMFLFSNLSSFGQAVSINSTGAAPDAQSILDVSSSNKGVLLPRLTNHTDVTPTSSSDFGLTVYDLTTSSYWYWDGTAWQEIPNMGSVPAVSLDDAYNGGTFITADAGAVDIQGAGGLLVTGKSAFGTTVDAAYQLSVLNSNNSVKIGGSSIGLRAEVQAVSEDGIYASHSSTGNSEAYYVVRGELSGWSANGYLGYHTTSGGGANYAVYGSGGDYAGYFEGNVNFTGDIRLNGSAGTAGQVLVSQGTGVDPIWGAAGVQSVTAGEALTNSGTATALILDVEANNGLNVDAAADRVQLGGALTEATTITQNGFDLVFNLNSTGSFIVQDGGADHFLIDDNDGNAFFGGDVTFNDGSSAGTTLVQIADAGSGDDGRIQVYNSGAINHIIHGDGDVVFNDLGNDRNFRVESDNEPNMFFLDAGLDMIGIGIGTPTAQVHTTGTLRFANYTNGLLQVDGSGNVSTATGSSLFTAGTGLSWASTTLNSVWTANGTNIHNNNTANVGVGTTTPDSKLHVDVQTNGFNVPLVVRNSGANTNGDVVGIGLVNEQVEYGNFFKVAMVSERTAGFGVGKLHFLVDGAADANSAALTDSKMTILPDGNVGIGVTAPTVKLQVAGDATISGKFNSNGIQESSDIRFKQNIRPIESALENILKINGVTYYWNTAQFPDRNFNDGREIGVIAQELEKVYPELVATDAEGYKSVQYSHLVPVLIEALKEQQAMIDRLSSTVSTLEASLTKLIGQSDQSGNQASAK
ncbi:MAG: hypothetical protein RL266_2423 [Bacteroidota bacterium]